MRGLDDKQEAFSDRRRASPGVHSRTPGALSFRSSSLAAELAAGLLLIAALLFGGGSRGMGDLVVHLAALPALALGFLLGLRLVRKISDVHYRKVVFALTVIGAVVMLVRR